jgi:hypothetical protein
MTPDNGSFAVAAYACAAIVYLVYAISLVARERKLRARLESREGQRH